MTVALGIPHSTGDFVLKNRFLTLVLKISGLQK